MRGRGLQDSGDRGPHCGADVRGRPAGTPDRLLLSAIILTLHESTVIPLVGQLESSRA